MLGGFSQLATGREGRAVVRRAFLDSLPVLMGYTSMGFVAGVLLAAKASLDHPVLWAALTSASCISGTFNFAIVQPVAERAPLWSVALMVVGINFRYVFYGFAMLGRWQGVSPLKKAFLVHTLADENFALEASCRYRGREAFTRYFQEQFPEESLGIQQYMDALYALTDQVGFFHLRLGSQGQTTYGGEFYEPSNELVSRYIRNPKLRGLLGYMSCLCGGSVGHTPAYVFSLINSLYINGHYRFEGPAVQLADVLVDLIESGGGQVIANAEVSRVKADGKSVAAVITADGREFRARHYVSDVHPQVLMRIADNELFTKAFRARVETAPNNYSAYCLYVVFKPDSFPYINHPCYYTDD